MSDSLLTIADVAKKLGVEDSDVRRLIARGGLKSTKLPIGWRVLDATLAAYVGSGAPDVKPPADVSLRFQFDKIEAAIWAAARPQFKTEEQAAAMFEGKFEPRLDVDLQITPEVRAVLKQPLDESYLPARDRGRFDSAGELLLVHNARGQVAGRAAKEAGLKTGTAGMFDSPEIWQAFHMAAVKELLKVKLAQSEHYRLPLAKPEEGQFRQVSIGYMLPIGTAWANDATGLQRAVDKAF